MAEGADESPPPPHDGVCDYRCGRGHGGLVGGKVGRTLQVGVPAEGPDVDGAVGVTTVISEIGDLVDVDEHLG